MVHAHVLMVCVLMGFSGVDLCFDSLVLFDHLNCPMENVQQVLNYYHRTRATPIVPLITVFIVLMAISLLRCVFLRKWTRDYVSLVAFLTLLPYYIFVMEPAEDACLGNHAAELSELQLRDGLFKVGLGHVLIIGVGAIVTLSELEFSFGDDKKKKQ